MLGAHGASAFAAIARQGVVYKVLAHAHCPVITLSPAGAGRLRRDGYAMNIALKTFLAGVF